MLGNSKPIKRGREVEAISSARVLVSVSICFFARTTERLRGIYTHATRKEVERILYSFLQTFIVPGHSKILKKMQSSRHNSSKSAIAFPHQLPLIDCKDIHFFPLLYSIYFLVVVILDFFLSGPSKNATVKLYSSPR